MALQNNLLQSLGMSLLHSLWQGAVLVVILQFLLALAGKKNASVRYVIHFTGLMVLTAGFFTTWYLLFVSMSTTPSVSLITDYPLHSPALPLPVAWSEGQSLSTTLRLWFEPVSPFLAAGWLIGFLGIALYTSASLFYSYRSIRSGLMVPGNPLLEMFQQANMRMNLSHFGRLRLTNQQVSPMVLGIIKPIVIIPLAVVNGLSPEQVEAVMLHELAHIRRYDPLMLAIQALATRILFFHPLAWYLSAEIDHERENSCDDAVLHTFSDPINYIKALTMIQELNMMPVPVNALTGRPKKLLGRVMRLLKPETGKSSSIRMTILFMLLISFGITAYAVVYSAKPDDPKPAPAGKSQTVVSTERDTVKNIIIKRSDRQLSPKEEKEQEKELAEARRQLEKAQVEMLKAQQEMERAHEQMRKVQEKFRQGELTLRLEDLKGSMDDMRFYHFEVPVEVPLNLEENEQFREQMEKLQEEMKRSQADMFKYQQMYPEQQEEMKRRMEEQFLHQKELKLKQEEAFRKIQEEWNKQHPEAGPEVWRQFHMYIPDVAPVPPFPEVPAFDLPPLPPMPDVMLTPDSIRQMTPQNQLRELEEPN